MSLHFRSHPPGLLSHPHRISSFFGPLASRRPEPMTGWETWTLLLALLLRRGWGQNNEERGAWRENSVVNFSSILASGNNLSSWTCHPHPQEGVPQLQIVPVDEDVNLTLTSEPVRNTLLLIVDLEDHEEMGCVELTDPWNQTGLWIKRPFLCTGQGKPCSLQCKSFS